MTNGESAVRCVCRGRHGFGYARCRARRVVPAVNGSGCGDVLRRARGGHGVTNGESAVRCARRGRHGARVMCSVVLGVGTVYQTVRARRGVSAVGGTGCYDTRTIFKKLYVTAARNSFE